jgi:transcriptional regulator with XRE-family HTH domain
VNSESKSELPWEAEFLAKFRKRRENSGLSQTAMAKLAAESGLPFHQQTIQRIEDGKRPLRLNEAIVLAKISGATLDELITPASPDAASQQLAMDVDGVVGRATDFIYRMNGMISELHISIAQSQMGHQLYLQACENLGQEVDTEFLTSVDAVLAEAEAALERLKEFADEWSRSASYGNTAIAAWEEAVSAQPRIPLWPEGDTNG